MAQRNRSVSLKAGKSREALTITHPNAAGIDISSAAHFVGDIVGAVLILPASVPTSSLAGSYWPSQIQGNLSRDHAVEFVDGLCEDQRVEMSADLRLVVQTITI